MTADVRSISGFVRRHARALAAAGVFLAAGYLGFARLDHTPFWDDEAYVGIIARNFLATGTLTGWDSRNLVAYHNGQLLDPNLHYINPPLDCLVAAGSFRLLGQTTWAGRFPFVVAGLIALAIFGLIVHRDFRGQPALWLYALAGLGLSVVFLLNIRQCRYYALGLLTVLLAYDAYRRCLLRGRLVHYLVFAAATIALFYASFLYCAAFLGTLAIVHLTFHRRRVRAKDLWKPALALACIAVATVPYAIQHRIWHRPDIDLGQLWHVRRPALLWWNLRELNMLGLPWTVAVLLVVNWILTWGRDPSVRRVLEYVVLGVGYTVFVALLSPQPVSPSGNTALVRYLVPAVPFLAVLVAAAVQAVHRRDPRLAGVLFAVVIATNLFSAFPGAWRLRWLLPAYVEEVHREYPTAYAEVVAYLRHHAQQDDVVFAWPEYTNYPILFYLGDRVRLGCLLSEQTPLPMDQVEKLERAGAPLLVERHWPDWIVFFGMHPECGEVLASFSGPHAQGGQVVRMRYEPVAILDVYWYDTYRPELHLHSFRPISVAHRPANAVHIFKGKLLGGAPSSLPPTRPPD